MLTRKFYLHGGRAGRRKTVGAALLVISTEDSHRSRPVIHHFMFSARLRRTSVASPQGCRVGGVWSSESVLRWNEWSKRLAVVPWAAAAAVKHGGWNCPLFRISRSNSRTWLSPRARSALYQGLKGEWQTHSTGANRCYSRTRHWISLRKNREFRGVWQVLAGFCGISGFLRHSRLLRMRKLGKQCEEFERRMYNQGQTAKDRGKR